MDSLTHYVTKWFHKREFFPYFSRGGWRINAAWLAEEEKNKPGFTDRLRDVALEYLSTGTPDEKIKALRALGVAAGKEDAAQIRELIANEPESLQREAQMALGRIEYRHSPLRHAYVAVIVVVAFLAIVLSIMTPR